MEKSDHRHPRLLRVRRERQRHRCAAEQRYELAASHSTTSSARATRAEEDAMARVMTRMYHWRSGSIRHLKI
jgi:hypothetical protein